MCLVKRSMSPLVPKGSHSGTVSTVRITNAYVRFGVQLLVVSVVVAGLGVTPRQARAGSWISDFPGVFSSEGSYPRVAMTQDGEAVIAYRGYGETIRVSRHPPNGSFSGEVFGEPVFPEPTLCCSRPEDPAVAINQANDTIVVWQQGKMGSSHPEIYSSFRPHGGSFSSPKAISSETATMPEVAIDAHGDATVVWLRDDGIDTIVEAATSTAGGPFSSPTKLSGDGGNAAGLQIAMDPEDDAIASWIRTSGANTEFEIAVQRAGGHFPAPDSNGDGVILGQSQAPTLTFTEPPVQHIAMKSGPEAIAVWRSNGNAVQEARLTSGQTTFGPLTTLGTTTGYPTVAVNEVGESVVDWPVSLGIDVSTALPAASFGPVEQIALPEGSPGVAKISLAPSGAVALAWLQDMPEHDGFYWIHQGATVRPPNGVFAKPSGMGSGSSSNDSSGGLEMAGDSLGDTLAVWQETTTIGDNVRGFVYDNGPTLTGVSIPAAAIVGQPVSFSVALPVTLWQPLTDTTWDFGDGTTVNGLSTTHIFKAPGVYSVTVSAADAQTILPGPFLEKNVENSVSRTITISDDASPHTKSVPIITHVKESKRIWRKGSALAKTARFKSIPAGTAFSYTLNESAQMHFAFTLLPDAGATKGKCANRASQSRRPRQCRRAVGVGKLLLPGHSGANRLYFQGRLTSKRSLKPGRYELTITASNSSGRSSPKSLSFTITR